MKAAFGGWSDMFAIEDEVGKGSAIIWRMHRCAEESLKYLEEKAGRKVGRLVTRSAAECQEAQ